MDFHSSILRSTCIKSSFIETTFEMHTIHVPWRQNLTKVKTSIFRIKRTMYSSNKIVLLISHWTLCALHNEKLETMKYSTHFNIRQSCFVSNMPTKIHFSLVTEGHTVFKHYMCKGKNVKNFCILTWFIVFYQVCPLI